MRKTCLNPKTAAPSLTLPIVDLDPHQESSDKGMGPKFSASKEVTKYTSTTTKKPVIVTPPFKASSHDLAASLVSLVSDSLPFHWLFLNRYFLTNISPSQDAALRLQRLVIPEPRATLFFLKSLPVDPFFFCFQLYHKATQ